jgi:hypothetical protein
LLLQKKTDITIEFSPGENGTGGDFFNITLRDITNNTLMESKAGFLSKTGFLSRFKDLLYFQLRSYFITDSIEIFKKEALLGKGGGTWYAFFSIYQDYFYWSADPHNFIIQIMLDTGLLGTLLILLLIFIITFMFIKNYKQKQGINRIKYFIYAIIPGAILGHSFMDFDLSIPAIFIIFIVVLVLFIKESNNKVFKDKKINPYFILIPAIIFAIIIINNMLAATNYNNAKKAADARDFYGIISYLEKTNKNDFLNQKYKIELANMYLVKYDMYEDKYNKIIEWLNKNAIYNYDSQLELVKLAIRTNNIGWLEKSTKRLLELRPLNQKCWDSILDYYYQAMLSSSDDPEKFMTLYNNYEEMLILIKTANLKSIEPFLFNTESIKTIQKIELLKKFKGITENNYIYLLNRNIDMDNDGLPDQLNAFNHMNIYNQESGIFSDIISAERNFFQRNI